VLLLRVVGVQSSSSRHYKAGPSGCCPQRFTVGASITPVTNKSRPSDSWTSPYK